MASYGKQGCELCQRVVGDITIHHLYPRTRHRNKKLRRIHDLHYLQNTVAYLCSSCHKFIHSQLSEKQMADSYHSIEALRSHEKIREFAEWMANKPSGFRCRSLRRSPR